MLPAGLLSALLALPAWADVASGGPYALIRSVQGFDSETAAGAADSVTFSLSDPFEALVPMSAGGADSLFSGYLSQIPSNSTSVAVVGLAQCPRSSGASCYGVATGAGPGFAIAFNAEMSLASVASAIGVTAVRNSRSSAISEAKSFGVQYSSSDPTALTIVPTGGWAKGVLYTIGMGSSAVDINGLSVAIGATFYLYTAADPDDDVIMSDINDANLRVIVPPGAFNADYVLTITTDVPAGAIASANRHLATTMGPGHQVLKTVQIEPFRTSGAHWSGDLGRNVTLSFPFNASNGVVTGTNPPVRTGALSAWRLDESGSFWVKQPGAVIDTVNNRVLLPTSHFSTYSIVGQQAADVDDSYAFPVPYRPNSGHAARFGSPATGIRFTNLPVSGSIRIYTSAGVLVRELLITANPQTWDVNTAAGQPAASGMYLWEVRSTISGAAKTGKLVIIR